MRPVHSSAVLVLSLALTLTACGAGAEESPASADSYADGKTFTLANVIAHLRHGRPLDAPLTAETTVAGHRMVEAAVESARTGRRVALDEVMAGEGGSR